MAGPTQTASYYNRPARHCLFLRSISCVGLPLILDYYEPTYFTLPSLFSGSTPSLLSGVICAWRQIKFDSKYPKLKYCTPFSHASTHDLQSLNRCSFRKNSLDFPTLFPFLWLLRPCFCIFFTVSEQLSQEFSDFQQIREWEHTYLLIFQNFLIFICNSRPYGI